MNKQKIIVIVGPNASGKSDFGVKLAKKINGEIISADSRQVYRGLDIGSGKVSGKWKVISDKKNLITQHSKLFTYKNIPHHCIDIANPKKVFTADYFRKCAQNAILDILSRGKTPIIVGGTGFYIDAALGRVKLGGIPPNHALRRKLRNYSTTKLLNYLTKLDPNRAKTIEQKNPRRLIRAIEVAKAKKTDAISDLILTPPAGVPKVRLFRSDNESDTVPKKPHKSVRNSSAFSAQEPMAQALQDLAQRGGASRAILQQENMRVLAKFGAEDLSITWLGIKRSPEELKKRIHKRLLARLPGIIREVKKLHHDGVSWKRLYDLGLEYRYASLYLRGKLNYQLMTIQLEIAIWHYAKRQITWFKKNKEIQWISTNEHILKY